MLKAGWKSFAVAMMLAGTPLLAKKKLAEEPAVVAAAPIPEQITAAKTVFISFAGQDDNQKNEGSWKVGETDSRCYDEFYAAMAGWGRWKIQSTPASADLVLEIQFENRAVSPLVSQGNSIGPMRDPSFLLRVIDPKTRIVLWGFTEHAEPETLQKSYKNFDYAMTNIVGDLKGLVSPPAAN